MNLYQLMYNSFYPAEYQKCRACKKMVSFPKMMDHFSNHLDKEEEIIKGE